MFCDGVFCCSLWFVGFLFVACDWVDFGGGWLMVA